MRFVFFLISSFWIINGFSQDVFLKGRYVHLGIHSAGSFGSSGNAPSGYFTRGSSNLGFVCDIDKDGFNKGNPSFAGDYFIPGSPEEGWGMQWKSARKGSKINFNNFGLNKNHDVKTVLHTKEVLLGSQRANWIGTAQSGNQKAVVQQTVILDSLDQHFTIEILIKNTGTDTLFELGYFRNVDPDNEVTLTSDYSTTNYVIHQPGVSGNKDKAMVMALGRKYGIPCILGAIDSRAKVSIGGFAVRSPDDIFSYNKKYTKSNPLVGDVAISLAFALGDLPPGKCITLVYFYALQSVVPNSKSFEFSLNNEISTDGFKTKEILSSKDVCLSDTTVEIKTSKEGSSVDFIDEILWDTDNNDTFETNGDSIKITFRGYKKHSIKQRITFCDGSFVDSVYNFEIVPKPKIDFGLDIKNACFNENQLEISNKSVFYRDSITQWKWYINDTLVSVIKSPTKLKAKYFLSDYFIKLIGISNNGCKDSSAVNFKLNESPRVSIVLDDTIGCLKGNLFSSFVNSSISSGSTVGLLYWGDGKLDTVKSLKTTHSYSKHGNYIARAQALSDSGCISSDSIKIYVYPQPQSKIVASDSVRCLGSSQFNFRENTQIDFGTLDFKWWSTFSPVIVEDTVYDVSPTRWGVHRVFLSSTSNNGCADSVSMNIFAAPYPLAQFSFNDSTQCLKGNKLELEDMSTSDTGHLSRLWMFSGNTDTSSRFSYAKQDYGRDFGSLITRNEFGCEDTVNITYRVFSQSQLNLSILKDSQCLHNNRFKVESKTTNREGVIKNTSWNWNNEFSSLGIFSEYSFGNSGVKNIQLITESDQGCLDTLKDSVFVLPQAYVGFEVNNFQQCLKGNLFETQNVSSISQGNLKYFWSLNDSIISGSKTLSHVISNWGNYNLKLKTRSDFGCVDSLVKAVEVFPQATLDIRVDIANQCLRGNNFNFENNSRIPNGDFSFTWNLDEGMSSNLRSPQNISYKTFGLKKVEVISVSNKNCKDTVNLFLRVNDQPRANFDFIVIDSCETSNKVQFVDLSKLADGIYDRKWEYEGYPGINDSIIYHSFSEEGYKEVKLVVNSGQGCADSVVLSKTIHPSPKVMFNVDPVICIKSSGLNTYNTSTVQSGTMAFKWILSDSVEFSGLDITNHRLKDTGTYQLMLIGNSDKFCSDTSIRFFRNVPNTYLSLDEIADLQQCFKYNSFDFLPKNQNESVGVVTNNWFWGDGQSQLAFQAFHSYDKPGEYLVRLYTLNSLGCRDTLIKAVKVLNPIEFSVIGDTVCFPEKNTIVSNSKCKDDNIIHHAWNIKGADGTGRITQINMNSVGSFSGILIVTTEQGCQDTLFLTDIVTVLKRPRADFALDTFKTLGAEMEIKINNKSSEDVVNWLYDFESIQILNSRNPTFIFADTGVKSVTLYVEALNGCRDTFQKVLGPFYPKYYQHIPNVFTPNDDDLNDQFLPILSPYLKRFEFSIYNKWGQQLFYSENPSNGWNGIYQNEEVPNDCYIYTLHVVDITGKRHFSKGQFIKM